VLLSSRKQSLLAGGGGAQSLRALRIDYDQDYDQDFVGVDEARDKD
jgi:hypothetical protein